MIVLNEIKAQALGIPLNGKSAHLLCPECGGGRTKERSFIIYRTFTHVYYECYRVTCGASGRYASIADRFPIEAPPQKKLRPYIGETRPLSDVELEYAWNKWYISEKGLNEQEICTDKATGRLVFPLYTKEGWCWGHQLRSIDGKGPKASLFWHSEYKERVHFPKALFTSDTVIVVEDIPSAIRVTGFDEPGALTNASGLLGTYISDSCGLLLAQSYKRAVIALDSDATAKAIKYQQKYAALFQELKVIPLVKDIKNMREDELRAFIIEAHQ